jgi:hypothetical protein
MNMKTKLSFIIMALFGLTGICKSQCTMTTPSQTVFGTPGTHTIGTGSILYIQICPNVLLYDTMGSSQRHYYLMPGAQLYLKNGFSEYVYMQSGSGFTRVGSGGNSATVYYEPSTTITGTMVSSFSCSAVSFPTVSCSAATGIREYENNDLLQVYPNPASGFVNVINDHAGELTATITNAVGKLERIVTLSAGNNTIDLYSLNAGIYFISVSEEKGIIARGKIMIVD